MTKPFHVVTISNDLPAYHAMRASMAAVGFTERACRFTLLDNSTANRHDPYRVLRDLPADGAEPYFILCHQDLRFDDRTGFERLRAAVAELDGLDPRWAVAGTAGVTMRAERVLHLDDPSGSYRSPGLPRRVLTLDENLLLVRRAAAPVPSPGLSGFHFYGADLCLSAAVGRQTCYVIDFPLTHLSGGTASPAFFDGLDALADSWRPRLLVGLVNTTCAEFNISCNPILSRALARPWFRLRLRDRGWSLVTRRGRVIREPAPPPARVDPSPAPSTPPKSDPSP